ncbi:MAG TPA: hypothetical protein VH518_16990, partial [Tepidisphaeraceae bacterium]
HGGRPAMGMSYTGGPARNIWCAWQRNDRSPLKFIGHKVRVTAWMKSEGLTGDGGISIKVQGANFQDIGSEGQRGKRPVRGTTEWTQYSAIATVPSQTQCICWGFLMNGRGKLWIDADSVQCEVID